MVEDLSSLKIWQQAALTLRSGGVIVCPTEGLYGLSCKYSDSKAIERILQIKQRAQNKGLIVVASSLAMLETIVDFAKVPSEQLSLLKSKWPGHYTFIVPVKEQSVPSILTGGRTTLAARVPNFKPLQELCEQVGEPLVSTSANLSGNEPLKDLASLHAQFENEVDYILDAPCGGLAKASIIIDALSGQILRA